MTANRPRGRETDPADSNGEDRSTVRAADPSADVEPHADVTTLDHGLRATARRVLGEVRSNPRLLPRELNRLYYRRFHTRSYNPDGVDIWAEDWDTLVVLDACRLDLFASRHTLPGTLESRVSRGSNTIEFLQGNFDGRELLDTVYVTANPQFFRRRDEFDVAFHDVINVWRDSWDDDVGTVRPGTMTDYALDAIRTYPNKRVLVHYMQPHYPFIGADFNTDTLVDESEPTVWEKAMAGDVDHAALRQAYRENFDRCLPHLHRLLDALEGRTVVTADHGNMLGERAAPLPIREWGHPVGIYTPELVDVPWLVHERGPRRRVRSHEPAANGEASMDEEVVGERLRQLGYRT